MNILKRKNIGLVISNLFLIIFLFFCVTPVWATDYDTMIILGSHLKGELTNRVNGAYDVIKSNNFNKIIVSGGCVTKSAGTTGLACPYDCSDPNCTEAGEMKKLLITKDPSLTSKIVLEDESSNTVSNYSHSKALLTPPGSSVVVVSNHEHVKAVSYALKHCDGFNAYYYFIGKTSQPEALALDDFANNDYSNIIKTCREKLGLSGTAASSVTVGTGIPFVNEIKIILEKPTPKISIPGLNFSDIKSVEEDGGRYLYIPFLGEYIAAIYKYGVVIASIIAVVMIINAGFGWAISGGEPEKINHAKTRIGQALVGLFLAVASYTLLYMINPELVKFRSLRVQYTPGIPLSEAKDYESGYGLDTSSAPSCADPAMIINDLSKIDFSLSKEYKEVAGKLTPEKIALYKQAVNAVPGANVPWEILATIHFKEASMSDSGSILNGGAFCNIINDGNLLKWCPQCQNPTRLNDLICGVKKIREKAGNGELSPSNLDTVKKMFCKYNGCYSCPDIQPYTAANLDTNHNNIPKQTHDCVPANCKMGVNSDITINPPIRLGCTITVFANSNDANIGLSNYCMGCQTKACGTPNGNKITYKYNDGKVSKTNPCGSWTIQTRAGALGIYAYILQLENNGTIAK